MPGKCFDEPIARALHVARPHAVTACPSSGPAVHAVSSTGDLDAWRVSDLAIRKVGVHNEVVLRNTGEPWGPQNPRVQCS